MINVILLSRLCVGQSDKWFDRVGLCGGGIAVYIIGRPMPRPGICGASPPAFGLFTVSSTERIKHVASPAACNAFNLIMDGSHTHASKLSAMCSLLISTPYQTLPTIEMDNVLVNDSQRTEKIQTPLSPEPTRLTARLVRNSSFSKEEK